MAEVKRRLGRAQDLYVAGQIEMEKVKRRNAPLLARRDELRARLAQAETVPPTKIRPFVPVAQAYARTADQLHLAIEGDDGEEVRTELRKLIERVVFTPLLGKGAFDLRVEGALARLSLWARAGVLVRSSWVRGPAPRATSQYALRSRPDVHGRRATAPRTCFP